GCGDHRVRHGARPLHDAGRGKGVRAGRRGGGAPPRTRHSPEELSRRTGPAELCRKKPFSPATCPAIAGAIHGAPAGISYGLFTVPRQAISVVPATGLPYDNDSME